MKLSRSAGVNSSDGFRIIINKDSESLGTDVGDPRRSGGATMERHQLPIRSSLAVTSRYVSIGQAIQGREDHMKRELVLRRVQVFTHATGYGRRRRDEPAEQR